MPDRREHSMTKHLAYEAELPQLWTASRARSEHSTSKMKVHPEISMKTNKGLKFDLHKGRQHFSTLRRTAANCIKFGENVPHRAHPN